MNKSELTGGLTARVLRVQLADELAHRAEAATPKAADPKAAITEKHRLLNEPMTAAEYEASVARLYAAAEGGKWEAVMLHFPAGLCTDHGRAVASGDPGWPATLPVKARSFFEHWEARRKELGYHVSARILDFPDGMPGEVGLVIDWRDGAAK